MASGTATSVAKHVLTSAKNPFSHFKLASWEPLRRASRGLCPRCGCSRKFYCYDCYEFVSMDPKSIPQVSLPVHVDIIKHPGEVAGKSTAVHARMLAQRDVTIHPFPSAPHIADPARSVLIYPKEGAMSVREWLQQCGTGTSNGMEWKQIERVIFIDSTWQQTHSILKDERVRHLPCVHLTEVETHFWRPQRGTAVHLATIEAVYYLFREADTCMVTEEQYSYDGRYDNLLYFYAYQYEVVEKAKQQREQPSISLS